MHLALMPVVQCTATLRQPCICLQCLNGNMGLAPLQGTSWHTSAVQLLVRWPLSIAEL